MIYGKIKEDRMKTILTVLFFILITTPAFAEDTWKTTCEALSETAGSIMSARQAGVPLAQMMNMLTEKEPVGATEKDKRYVEGLVLQAYEQPRFNTEDDKNNSINDFQNTIYLRCAKMYR